MNTSDSQRIDALRDAVVNLASIQQKAYSSDGAAKASAIMAGAAYDHRGDGPASFLAHIAAARRGDPASNDFVKGVLGTSIATGLALVPGNMVDAIATIAAIANPYRDLMTVVSPVNGKGVDIPYEVTGHTAALLQGAYGSNKSISDFSLGSATATLYQIATIIDLGNQLIRQSGGAAEQLARQRLGKAFGLAESNFILNGTGTNQPLGIFTAFLAYGDIAAYKTTLSSEPRAATIGRALGALESRNQRASAIVLNPATFWSLASEGLGTAYAGGWALEPSAGPAGSAPTVSLWGVPVVRDGNMPTGTGLVGNFRDCHIFLGGDMTIDVSSEAGDRWDQDVTGYRCEEEFGFNATPYVNTGAFQKVLGL